MADRSENGQVLRGVKGKRNLDRSQTSLSGARRRKYKNWSEKSVKKGVCHGSDRKGKRRNAWNSVNGQMTR